MDAAAVDVPAVDAPAIEELPAGRDSNENCRITVLGDADGRGSLRLSSVNFIPHLPLRKLVSL